MERSHDGVPSKLDECSLGGAAGTESRPMLFSHRDNLSADSPEARGRSAKIQLKIPRNRMMHEDGTCVFSQ